IMEAQRQGQRLNLAPLPIQYVDYAVWQRKWLEESGILKQQLAYWQEKLAGAAESLDLATDYPRPSVQSFAGATHKFALDAQLTGQLKSMAQHQGGTLYMVLLAAFKALLYRYTGQNDICVGSPISNRQCKETSGLIGMFVNTLALRSQVEGKDTFSALLSQVKVTCLEAYAHQDAPFEKVVDLVHPQRNLAITPLFQVMVSSQTGAHERMQPYSLETGISKFDISLDFAETATGLTCSIEYSTALYKPQTIARMGEHFMALCKIIAAAPTAKICDLDYISDAEKHRLLIDYNDTRADYPKDKCIHDFFIEQVQDNPGARAVVFGEQELSYQELYEKSSNLALYLQSLGVKPDSVVGLCMERSLEMMVGIMGTVQAGGAYLPLDPDYPDDRLAYMLQDSQAGVVLTQERFKEKISSLLAAHSRVIALDEQWPEVSQCVADLKAKKVELRREVQPHNINYVIYTSGSTGKPKGVLVEHRALVNRLHWMQKRYALTKDDVVLQKTPYSFDVSVWEFFWPMMAGASLVFAVPEGHKDVEYLENLIHQAGVTTLHFVPSMLRSYLENARSGCNKVKQIFCSGEALDRKSVDDYKAKFPNAVLHNLYGPTEAAIDVTAYDCSQLNDPFVPIGAPIDNTQIYILDEHNHPQPIGVPGELHIAGDGLARGYLNRPELTQEKFVANPFTLGTRMYKTGDLARWLEDGNIQYLGRIDTQVKIRGFRIELGEIEACLNQHPEIQDSAVIAKEQEGNRQLIAFYRAKETTAEQLMELPNEELRGHLLKTVPDYMVPAAFVSLAAIPLNANGKVDRRELARMEVRIASDQEYVGPGNDVERQLVEIWAQVLHLAPEKIGVNDNFFELGGHSLLATRLMAKIRSQLNIDLPLKTLFERTSVSQLAELIPQMGK
ncbi:MAG: amino acid adenylation domain-containing protein, partial [Acidobacteriia bacterium]|nr:amino acid adenylation domain-containing protein [Terriglobia bacterium]